MYLKLASELSMDSIVDGPGLRMVIWTQGCPHNCKGCHNPQTHDYNGGINVDVDSIISEIKKSKLQKGITISGGEPFIQVEPLIEVVKRIKHETTLDIWLYTGYTFEQLISFENVNREKNIELLKYIDVLVDGKFEENKKNIELLFRGSSNQRLLNIKEMMSENDGVYEIIDWEGNFIK